MESFDARKPADQPPRLTWREVCEQFPDEWVVLVDVDWKSETDFAFECATVIAHHKRRRDASPDVKSAFQDHSEVGCYWTGKIRGPVPRYASQ